MCVVTGASGGIGAASVELFRREGARVVGVDLAEGAPGDLSLQVDVTDEQQVREMYARVRAELGRIDVLFNNAGISPDRRRLGARHDARGVGARAAGEPAQRVPVLQARHPPPARQSGGGSVINTASFVAVMGAATSQISYTASKGGVLALSRELGVEFARRGVRVNALCPGPVDTPLLQELYASDPEQAARRLVHVPMGRFARAEEIAQRRAVPRLRRVELRDRLDVPRGRRPERRLHDAAVAEVHVSDAERSRTPRRPAPARAPRELIAGVDLEAARRAIAGVAPCEHRRSPARTSPSSPATPVALKAECLQGTGSFKLRGALSKVAALGERAGAGLVTASAGNHGRAVAQAARVAGVGCEVFMPRDAAVSKVAAVERLGARVRLEGGSVEEALALAGERAERDAARRFVHPFDDLDVIAGQGTLGLELLEDVPDLARVVVPVGGGGLASGVGIALRGARPEVELVGVQASACAPYVEALRDADRRR